MAENKQITVLDQFRRELDLMKPQLQMALPNHLTIERFTRNLQTAVQEIPDLLNCDRKSLFKAAMTAAHLGLLVGSALGQAYIIPFNSKTGKLAQFIPGYRGYIVLARNSGEVESVAAYEVCANDTFEYELGLTPKCRHIPAGGERGEITHAYCIVRYKDGGHHVEVMSKKDIDGIRARSRAGNSGPWQTDYMMMARKTVIRRASRYMPLSVQRLAAIDNAVDTGQHYEIKDDGNVTVESTATEVPEPQTEKPSALDQFEQEQPLPLAPKNQVA